MLDTICRSNYLHSEEQLWSNTNNNKKWCNCMKWWGQVRTIRSAVKDTFHSSSSGLKPAPDIRLTEQSHIMMMITTLMCWNNIKAISQSFCQTELTTEMQKTDHKTIKAAPPERPVIWLPTDLYTLIQMKDSGLQLVRWRHRLLYFLSVPAPVCCSHD